MGNLSTFMKLKQWLKVLHSERPWPGGMIAVRQTVEYKFHNQSIDYFIADLLTHEPENFWPLFEEDFEDGMAYTIVDDWCVGYMRCVALAEEHWALDSTQMKDLLAPILAFKDEQVQITEDCYDDQEIDELCAAIAPNAREIHAFWLARRSQEALAATNSLSLPEIGRDDPCFCGSGKPFRHCCLH